MTFDPTKNERPTMLLSADEQRAMEQWPHGHEVLFSFGWATIDEPCWTPHLTYRGRPAPDYFDWTGIDKKWRFYVREGNGTITLCANDPCFDALGWNYDKGARKYINGLFDATRHRIGACDWRDSKLIRPEGV